MKLFLQRENSSQNLEFFISTLSKDWEVLELAQDAPEGDLARILALVDAGATSGWAKSMPPAPNMKLLQISRAGFGSVDFSALPPGCVVCNVYEHESAIAEYLVLAMLEWEIGLQRMDARMRRGLWSEEGKSHGRLEGKTVGFVGYGHIARETVRRLAAFGVRVMARTRRPESGDAFVQDIAGMDRLDSMLEAVDFLVIACPLNDASHGLIGERELKLMKPSAVLMNVARAHIVDEDALFEACRDRRIGGAVLDVWYKYPKSDGPCFPSERPFHELENVLMSPHASAGVEDLVKRRGLVMAENLNRFARGEALLNVVKRPS